MKMFVGSIAWEKRGPVIRQAISCDICRRDKQQTNHWFVAYEHGAELRISGWHSQARMSAKAKHLCGQTCLHKLVDDFMARTIAMRVAALQVGQEADDAAEPRRTAPVTDTTLTSSAAHTVLRSLPLVPAAYHDDIDSSARLIASPKSEDKLEAVPPPPSTPTYNARAWRAEAWKREQEREKRSAHNAPAPRRRSIA